MSNGGFQGPGIELALVAHVQAVMIGVIAAMTLAPMPLGLGLQNASQLPFLNEHFTSADHVTAHSENLGYLAKVEKAEKVLLIRGAEYSVAARLISEARAKGVKWIGFNLEGPLSDQELALKENSVADLAHRAGMAFMFGPTVRSLQSGYKLFVGPADAVMVQSQRFETDGGYKQIVTDLVGKLRAAKPGLKVWVQVSVNPPGNRNIPVEQVVNAVRDLEGIADGVFVFNAPFRWKAAQDVIRRLRP